MSPPEGIFAEASPQREGAEQAEDRGGLEEENPQEVEELREYVLDSFESQPEPSWQAEMVSVIWIDRDDLKPHLSRGLQGLTCPNSLSWQDASGVR